VPPCRAWPAVPQAAGFQSALVNSLPLRVNSVLAIVFVLLVSLGVKGQLTLALLGFQGRKPHALRQARFGALR
jgi:hypothetical protein